MLPKLLLTSFCLCLVAQGAHADDVPKLEAGKAVTVEFPEMPPIV